MMGWWKLLSRKVRNWSQLSPQEQRLFYQAYPLFLVVTLALQVKGLRWTQTLLAQRCSQRQINPASGPGYSDHCEYSPTGRKI